MSIIFQCKGNFLSSLRPQHTDQAHNIFTHRRNGLRSQENRDPPVYLCVHCEFQTTNYLISRRHQREWDHECVTQIAPADSSLPSQDLSNESAFTASQNTDNHSFTSASQSESHYSQDLGDLVETEDKLNNCTDETTTSPQLNIPDIPHFTFHLQHNSQDVPLYDDSELDEDKEYQERLVEELD